jgi:O-methyltransferase
MNKAIFNQIVSPYSMTTTPRINCLYDSLEFVRNNNISGDYVECGVWKGGNILGIMNYLEYHCYTTNNIWLYDTFQGMTEPENIDIDLNNNKAENILHQVFCLSPLDEVKRNLSSSKYPTDKIKYIIGDVCQTLSQINNIPEKIAILRLDTDWYASTKMELEVLWEKLEIGAPCIIDDYGHWKGCKKAVDDFFEKLPLKHTYEIIDYTGIRILKRC